MVKQSRNKGIIAKCDIVDALKKANIPDDEYSIDGYCESCLCIEVTDNGWEVYHGERGVKHNTSTYTSLDALVTAVCDRLGYAKPITRVRQESQIRTTQSSLSIPFRTQPTVAVARSSSPVRKVALKKATFHAYKIRTGTFVDSVEGVSSSQQITGYALGKKSSARMRRKAKSKQEKLHRFSKKLGK